MLKRNDSIDSNPSVTSRPKASDGIVQTAKSIIVSPILQAITSQQLAIACNSLPQTSSAVSQAPAQVASSRNASPALALDTLNRANNSINSSNSGSGNTRPPRK